MLTMLCPSLRRLLPLLAAATLAACAQGPGGTVSSPFDFSAIKRAAARLTRPAAISPVKVGDELLVGNAVTGERCRLRKLVDGDSAPFEDFVALCDGWNLPAGRLRRFPAAANERLEPFLTDPALVLWAPGEAQCEAVEQPSGSSIIVRRCTSSDGWPMLAWAAPGRIATQNATYVGFGLPHLATLVEPVLTGAAVDTAAAGTRSPLVTLARLQAAAGGKPVTLAEIMDFRTVVELARRYDHAGEFTEAVRAYERALDLQRAGQGRNTPYAAPLEAALGLNLADAGRPEEARLAFVQAEKLAAATPWNDAYATYLSYRAGYVRRYESLDAALVLAREATERRRALFGPDSSAVAWAMLVEAGARMDQGDLASARAQLREAQTIFEGQQDFVALGFLHARRAEIERRDARLDAARSHAIEAVRLSRELFGQGPNLVATTLDLGRIELATGRVDAALAAFRDGIAAARASRGSAAPLRVEQLDPYLEALLLAAARQPAGRDALYAEAFEAAQLVRRPTVERAVRQMAARLASDDPALRTVARELQTAIEEREAAQLTLGRLRLGDTQLAQGAPEAELRARVAAAEQAVTRAEAQLQRGFPSYGALIVPNVVSARELSRALRPGEVVLQVLMTEAASYAFALGADGTLTGHRGALGRASAEERVRALRRSLTFADGLQPFDPAAAHALYADLLGPLGAGVAQADHLLFVPDGPLLSLPIEVLVTAPAAGGDYRGIPFLGRDVAVSTVPSLVGIRTARTALSSSRASQPFLGIGDPVLSGQGEADAAAAAALAACQQGEVYDPRLLRALAALPETRDELRRVAQVLGSSPQALRFGEDAHEAAIKRLPLRDYRVISFATHGLLPAELRCRTEPGLVLTPPRRATATDDGLLTAGEIAQLDLDADLVVLSACNTAGPDGSLGGEALSGLASAFAYAGARNLLVSHWDVASAATVRLMTGLFEAQARGRGRAMALREARAALLGDSELAHPAYWGAFVLLGDGAGAAGGA